MIRNSLLVVVLALIGCPDTGTKDTSPVNDDPITDLDNDVDQDGFTTEAGDCDDNDASVNPGAEEICNGLDDNCSGTVDEGVETTFYQDFDNDGFGNPDQTSTACEAPEGYVTNGSDCDDAEDDAFPGNVEQCDGVDNDCDGEIDDGVTTTWYADADADGFGDSASSTQACDQPTGYVADATDCNDSTSRSFPGNTEVCDELDNDCDGTVDDGVTTTYYADRDADGYGDVNTTQDACSVPTGYSSNDDDCDDTASSSNPAATEYCNGADDDCDGTVDEDDAVDASTWYRDADSDAYGDAASTYEACSQPSGYVADKTDCDDARSATNPGASEYCNTYDDDCDGTTDEDSALDASTWYMDADSDSYGDASTTDIACTQPSRYVADNTDCDDGDRTAYPGAAETCDGVDDDCDGTVDEGVTTTYYLDSDGDTYGTSSSTTQACSLPSGYSANSSDCDDSRALSNPAASEYCNTYDDDCDGTVDEDSALDAPTWYQDADSDAYGNASVTDVACSAPSGYVSNDDDCLDTRAASNPAATEYCNTYDDDCDGTVDEDSAADASTWYLDADGDTYGDASSSTRSCSQPSRYVADDNDCDDSDDTSYPGGTEVCDGADNDCNGTVDDNPTDGTTYYADDDSDGYGDPDDTVSECSMPSGYVDNTWDCDDTDGSEPVVADAVAGTAAGTGTLASPLDTLQEAIDRSYQCVIAYAGTYTEEIDLDGKSIDVWGIEGADYTTIDANGTTCSSSSPGGCAPTVTVGSKSNATPTIHGFTITGGTGYTTSSTSSTSCADSSASHTGRNTCSVTTYEYCGGGIYVEGDDPYFYDLIVTGNDLPEFAQDAVGSFTQYWLYSYGGGVCLKDSNATFETTTIAANFADQGGGIYATDNATFSFEEGYVSENDASDGGGVGVSMATANFTNAIVHCNAADTDGGGLFTETSGSSTFTNTVLFGNSSSTTGSARGSEAYVGSSTSFYLYNSIVQTSFTVYALYGVGSGTFSYNNVYNSAGSTYGGTFAAGVGSISSGSNFTRASCDNNPYNDDFSLASTSSSINAGNAAAAYNDADGTRNDMGAYGGPGSDW